MRITILGCGTSSGVPQIGCSCEVCRSHNPKNKRLRCSLFLEAKGQKILFDAGPDLRMQCLVHGISFVDALVFTHAHADHIHGLDDIRQINNVTRERLPTFAHQTVLDRIESRFPYAFWGGRHADGGFFRPDVDPKPFDGPFSIGDLDLVPFLQKHGRGESWGFRIGDFAYSTDTDGLSDEALGLIANVKVWVVDALREMPHPSHAHLQRTLGWIEKVQPEKAYLTHMNHEVDYDDWLQKLPKGVEPAFDGLRVTI